MRLKPAPTKASSSVNEVGSSTVNPQTFPPNASGATSNPEFPKLRFCMIIILHLPLSIRSPERKLGHDERPSFPNASVGNPQDPRFPTEAFGNDGRGGMPWLMTGHETPTPQATAVRMPPASRFRSKIWLRRLHRPQSHSQFPWTSRGTAPQSCPMRPSVLPPAPSHLPVHGAG